MPIWTDPVNVVYGTLMRANVINQQIYDNLRALHKPPTATSMIVKPTHYVKTTMAWEDVDTSPGTFEHTITTGGGDVLIVATLLVRAVWTSGNGSDEGIALFDVYESGVGGRLGGPRGLVEVGQTRHFSRPATLYHLQTNVPAGTHTYRLQWATRTNTTATLYCGDVRPQFIVREL